MPAAHPPYGRWRTRQPVGNRMLIPVTATTHLTVGVTPQHPRVPTPPISPARHALLRGDRTLTITTRHRASPRNGVPSSPNGASSISDSGVRDRAYGTPRSGASRNPRIAQVLERFSRLGGFPSPTQRVASLGHVARDKGRNGRGEILTSTTR